MGKAKKSEKRSLARVIAVPLIVFGVLGCLVLVALSYFITSHHVEKRLSTEAHLIANTIHSISETVSKGYELQSIVSSIGAESDIKFIGVLKGSESLVVASTRHALIGKKLAPDEFPQLSEIISDRQMEKDKFEVHLHSKESFILTQPIQFSQEHMMSGHQAESGYVIIELNSAPLRIQTIRQTKWLTATSLFIGVILIGFALFLLKHHINDPLIQISSSVEESSSHKRDPMDNSKMPNELAQLADKLYESISSNREKQEELRKARNKAELAAQAKSEFLATMSHEIRTPMNGIVGFADLLSGENLTKPQRDYVETIQHSSSSLLGIINDILDFSKIEAGKLSIENKRVFLKSLVEETVSLFTVQTKSTDLNILIDIEESAPKYISVDPLRLRQVLSNLLSNALKFTHKGEIIVKLEGASTQDNYGGCQFSIKDTGIGIPKDKLDSLFDKFTQADNSTTRIYGGTGLGLAICKRLIELMGGKIGLKSELGQGSTFWFILPGGDNTANFSEFDGGIEKSAVQTGRGLSYKIKTIPAKILLAEDNRTNQKLVKRILEKKGHSVTVAINGAEAVALAKLHYFDIILMDCQMPLKDGFDATKEIKISNGASSTSPIIALTANALPEDHMKCMDAGMSDYLSKPVRASDLLEIIAKWQQNSNANRNPEKSV